MSKYGVIPVIAIESTEFALPLADALIAGGLPVAEITFRTQAAADVIAKLKRERPELLLGAGTILDVEQLARAQKCGAVFGVSPGLNPEVVKKAVSTGFPMFPGIMTPTEIEQALSFGVKTLKFFPSEAAGGIDMLKSVSAPYAHLGVKYLPTGGVNINNLEKYLNLPQVLAVGGTWIATKEMISAQRWDEVKKNATDAVAVVKKLRK